MSRDQKKVLTDAICRATIDPYHFVIPMRSVVRQLCYRRNMIQKLENGVRSEEKVDA